jgi:hypothetical protein
MQWIGGGIEGDTQKCHNLKEKSVEKGFIDLIEKSRILFFSK